MEIDILIGVVSGLFSLLILCLAANKGRKGTPVFEDWDENQEDE